MQLEKEVWRRGIEKKGNLEMATGVYNEGMVGSFDTEATVDN